MKITNEFTVPIPVDQAWRVLTDLEGIAPCMPGAQLTGIEGEVYKGKVKVKVGPVISEFAGTAQFTSKDDGAYRAVIDAKGRDARSAGNASATVSAALTPAGDHTTKVSVDTDLKISGKLAQFGSGMIKEVSSKLLTQFVANLEAKLAAGTPAPVAVVQPGPAAFETAVATAPDTAVALDETAPAGPANDDATAPAIAPDPSAGDIQPAAGQLATAEGAHDPAAVGSTAAAGSVATDSVVTGSPGPGERELQTTEPEAIDLLAVAGGSIYKRVIPVAVGAVVVAAVIVWFVARG